MLSWMITMAGGVALACLINPLPSLTTVGVALFLVVAALFVNRKFLLLASFTIGLAWGVVYGHDLLATLLPHELEGEEVWVKGTVIGLPQENNGRSGISVRFTLAIDGSICTKIPPERCYDGVRKIQLSMYSYRNTLPEIVPGQLWRLLVKLKRPYGMSNPGGFDYQSWLIQQGMGAVGYVRENSGNVLLVDRSLTIDRLRWQFSNHIDDVAGDAGGIKHSSLIKALLIGDKRHISSDQWALFAHTGITHLMVISGLHVGLIAAAGYLVSYYIVLLFGITRSHPERWAACTAMFTALAYSLAAGFSLPTQRALAMIVVMMLIIAIRRNIDVTTGFVTALLLCLIIDPLAPVSQSFWLSFGAVAAILWGNVGRRQASRWRLRWFSAQYLVFIGLLPVMAIVLGRISLVSPLANLVLVPAFSFFVIPFNLLAGVVSLFWEEVAQLIWRITDQLVIVSIEYLEILNHHLDHGLIFTSEQTLATKLLATLAVVFLLLPRGFPLKAAAGLLLLPLFLTTSDGIHQGDVSLTVLDVGQGLSVVARTKNHTLVYDVGPRYSESFDTATAVVLPYLRHKAIRQIDTLVISHADNDHAGAWFKLAEGVDVQQLFVGESLTGPRSVTDLLSRSRRCEDSHQWWWDEVHFQFIYPSNAGSQESGSMDYRSANNRSCVLVITSGKYRFLLPGDIERSVEEFLVSERPSQLKADVLIAPHHGSNTSSSEAFIETTLPNYVVFSSGYRNQFRHPAAKVVNRYRENDVKMLNTSDSGAITFLVENGELTKVSEHRAKIRRYWL